MKKKSVGLRLDQKKYDALTKISREFGYSRSAFAAMLVNRSLDFSDSVSFPTFIARFNEIPNER